MEVYIEYVIIDNLIIDYLLLKVSLKLSRTKTSVFRLLSASALGTVVAVIMPLLKLDFAFLAIIKVTLAVLMIVISGKFNDFNQALKTFCFFIAFTALGGGAIIAAFNFAKIDYEAYFTVNYQSFMPVGISVLIIYALTKITHKLTNDLLKSRDIRPFVRKCEIICGKKKYKINGYIDSGNRLFDYRSGLPVIILSKRAGDVLISKNMLKKYGESFNFSTVSGHGEMQLYVVDKLAVYGSVTKKIYNNVLIGRGFSNFENDGDYDLLLSPSLF